MIRQGVWRVEKRVARKEVSPKGSAGRFHSLFLHFFSLLFFLPAVLFAIYKNLPLFLRSYLLLLFFFLFPCYSRYFAFSLFSRALYACVRAREERRVMFILDLLGLLDLCGLARHFCSSLLFLVFLVFLVYSVFLVYNRLQ